VVLDNGWSPMGLRKPLGRHLGGFIFWGGCSWAMGKFISGFVSDFR